MSSSVIVLQEGYSRWEKKPTLMKANGTSTLIQTSGKNILVDTLGPWDREKLVQYLANRHLVPDDIDILVCTHLHTDHTGNLNLFTKCRHFVGDQITYQDSFEFDIFNSQKSINLAPNVELFFTPGHTENDVSLIVQNVDLLGTVAITGDLFESEADRENESLWLDAGSVLPDLQRENRKLMLSIADYIVPGHGAMFKCDK